MSTAIVSEMVRTTQRIEPRVEQKTSSTRPHPIELQTENGFGIIRRCDIDEPSSPGGAEHCFVVRDPDGYELDVTVIFTASAIAEVLHHSFGRITRESSYWLATAEHHLSDYLWENEDCPPNAELTIDYATPDDLDLARRWGRNVSPQRAAGIGLLALIVFALSVNAHAQQTVFNVPTTDVLDKGKVYFELDSSAKPNDSTALNHFSSFVPRVVVGAGHNIEVGLNVLGNIQPGPDATTLVPAFKYRIYSGKDNGWAVVVGDHIFIPIHNRAYNVGDHAYLITQKSFRSGTRMGFGAGLFTDNVVAPNATRGVGMFTFEQPITRKLNWNADWFTGKHAAGYFTTGAAYKLTKKLTGIAAYSIGNSNVSNGNHSFYFELGYNFN